MIVDEHASVRGLLAHFFACDQGHEIVGVTGSGLEGLKMTGEYRPDLIILGLKLTELHGLEVLRTVKARFPTVSTLVLTATQNTELLVEVLRAEPDGMIAQSDDLQILRDSVRAVLDGARYFSSGMKPYHALARERAGTLHRLSGREREVLRLVAEGRSSKEIAQQLSVATKTIEHHRERLRCKLGVSDAAGLTRHAVRMGLIGVD